MSGPATHHIVAELFLKNVLKVKYTDAASRQFWSRMSSGQFGPQFLFGSQGPDFLFFNLADWPAGAKSLGQTYLDVQDFLQRLSAQVKAMIPAELWQAIDTLEGLAEDAAERSATLSQIEALASDVKDNIAAIKADVLAKIELYVTDSYDLFGELKHPQQHGQVPAAWWWFDTLHIRRSGRFLHSLMKNSAHGTMQRAYALGYLTHYAADAVGHPFVNIVCGGPYRTHSQRHKVSENHQDTWALDRYLELDLPTSNLSRDYVINGNADKLPRELNTFFLTCLREVYYDGRTPRYGKDIQPEDLDTAYRLWLRWFTGATNDLGLPLPQPYSLTAEIAAAWEKFTDNVGDIADYVGDSLTGGGGLWGFLKALAALIVGPILLAAALIDFILGELVTLAAAPIRYFLSLSYQALYSAFLNLRKGLVMNGFAFPRVADLGDPIVRHMLHTKEPDSRGNNASSLRAVGAYPASKFVLAGMEAESHLIYPLPSAASAEVDSATGAPETYFSANASWYIDDPKNKFSPDQFAYFRGFAESGPATPTASAVEGKYAELAVRAAAGGLGNALACGEALYAEHLRDTSAPFPDFNLDADRGYAFKSWRKVKDLTSLNSREYFNQPIETDREVPDVVDDVLHPSKEAL